MDVLVESVGNGVHFGSFGEYELIVTKSVLIVEVSDVEDQFFDEIDLISKTFQGFACFGKLQLILNGGLE